MSINLQKGQKIDLTKDNSNLNKVMFGLGWDVNRYDGNDQFDLDVSAFLTDDSGHCPSETDMIFYNNTRHPSGAVMHSGDNRTGEGEGDDETILVELSKIPANITKISFVVTIDQAEQRMQNFGMVESSYIRAVDQDTNEELFRYDLEEDYSLETGIVAGELYKHNGNWKFNAVGSGFKGGLAAILSNFGLSC